MADAAAPVWTQVGLKENEYRRIIELLGREPNAVELAMFGVMWSEHCAYKHSRTTLQTLPTEGARVLQGPGENAGVIDLGDGWAVAFKVESHNHPSAIEPFQGAATGVGGILRDVFTMGARPIALLDSLRFGEPDDARTRHLFSGVVAGISFYGNCIGVPTVAGEVYFEAAYKGNPLVNAMCVGLLRPDEIQRGIARGPGNPVLVVGARTGRDGIAGAAFASEELSAASEEKRPAVQVGDPFMEKLLLEACLELYRTGAVVAIQDMGAAGVTSSSSEMAHRGGVGIDIDVARVPRREEGMTPYEILLSESQERMLVVLERGREDEAVRIFAKWGLKATVVGQVTDDKMLRIREGDKVVAEIPADALADGPVYHPVAVEPEYRQTTLAFRPEAVPIPADLGAVLQRLMGAPNLCSREWVWRQYDHQVLTNTAVLPGSDAAVLRVKGSRRGIAVKIDGNGRYTYLDPYRGGAIAVAEAARNVVCSGGEPVALTNNLNFGNPEKPGVFWQFSEAVRGMGDACRALGTPVTGGNVSFYNESEGAAIYPTPTVGMVGVVADIDQRMTAGFKQPGDVIVLIGETGDELGGSEYLKTIHGLVAGLPPAIDLERERAVQQACLGAIRAGLLSAAHDVSDGGLAVALAEMAALAAAPEAAGCRVSVAVPCRADAVLFGESQSRIVVTAPAAKAAALLAHLETAGVPHCRLGAVAGGRLVVSSDTGAPLIDLATDAVTKAWREGIACRMN